MNNITSTTSPANYVPVLMEGASLENIDCAAVIRDGITINGGLENNTTSSILILGSVKGDIVSKGPVLIMPEGTVHGSITAPEARIMGKVCPAKPDASPVIVKVGYCHLGSAGMIDGSLEYIEIVMERGSGISGGMKRLARPASVTLHSEA